MIRTFRAGFAPVPGWPGRPRLSPAWVVGHHQHELPAGGEVDQRLVAVACLHDVEPGCGKKSADGHQDFGIVIDQKGRRSDGSPSSAPSGTTIRHRPSPRSSRLAGIVPPRQTCLRAISPVGSRSRLSISSAVSSGSGRISPSSDLTPAIRVSRRNGLTSIAVCGGIPPVRRHSGSR